MAKFRIPKKYQKYIISESIDVFAKNDLQAWLSYGYCYDYENSATHTRSYDTLKEILSDLENVYICNCSDCATKPLGTHIKDLHNVD
jgi:hypothetical protein